MSQFCPYGEEEDPGVIALDDMDELQGSVSVMGLPVDTSILGPATVMYAVKGKERAEQRGDEEQGYEFCAAR